MILMNSLAQLRLLIVSAAHEARLREDPRAVPLSLTADVLYYAEFAVIDAAFGGALAKRTLDRLKRMVRASNEPRRAGRPKTPIAEFQPVAERLIRDLRKEGLPEQTIAHNLLRSIVNVIPDSVDVARLEAIDPVSVIRAENDDFYRQRCAHSALRVPTTR